MAWFQYRVEFVPEKKEILNAFLISIEADAILEEEDHFICYKDCPINPEEFREQISNLPGVQSEVSYKICEEKNWNAEWEANYKPIAVDDVCYIRAEFHEPNPSFNNEIIIRPEMAFGTGHHETTYMMIGVMNSLDFSDCKVLDYGCGTGILSVFAAQKGANSVLGIDIEKPAVENAKVHQQINDLDQFDMNFLLGGLEVLTAEKYDIILANINRRVLLETKSDILNYLSSKGTLIMSGILKSDEELIIDKYSDSFDLIEKKEKGEWLCFLWKSKN